MLAFYRTWWRWTDALCHWYLTPAGERFNALMYGLVGIFFAGTGLLVIAGLA